MIARIAVIAVMTVMGLTAAVPAQDAIPRLASASHASTLLEDAASLESLGLKTPDERANVALLLTERRAQIDRLKAKLPTFTPLPEGDFFKVDSVVPLLTTRGFYSAFSEAFDEKRAEALKLLDFAHTGPPLLFDEPFAKEAGVTDEQRVKYWKLLELTARRRDNPLLQSEPGPNVDDPEKLAEEVLRGDQIRNWRSRAPRGVKPRKLKCKELVDRHEAFWALTFAGSHWGLENYLSCPEVQKLIEMRSGQRADYEKRLLQLNRARWALFDGFQALPASERPRTLAAAKNNFASRDIVESYLLACLDEKQREQTVGVMLYFDALGGAFYPACSKSLGITQAQKELWEETSRKHRERVWPLLDKGKISPQEADVRPVRERFIQEHFTPRQKEMLKSMLSFPLPKERRIAISLWKAPRISRAAPYYFGVE